MKTINCCDRMSFSDTFTEQEQASEIRNKKVQDTRRKIKSGKYNPDNHLNIALDRLIEEILKQNPSNQTDLAKIKRLCK